MKVSSRHIVEVHVPLPLGVSVRMNERRMDIEAESSKSTDHAVMQIALLAAKIGEAVQVEQAEQA